MNKKNYYFYCSECRQLCNDVERDFGIGSYEFWGSSGCDSDVQAVSECCDGDLIAPDEFQDWLAQVDA
jgi:hypothetical protein